MLVVFTLISTTVWAGNEGAFNSKYKISPDLNFNSASGFQQSWDITYGESKTPVQVLLRETKKGQEYFVRTKYFEVKYVNGNNGFGVKLIYGSESTVSESLNEAVLNKNKLASQKIISAVKISDDSILETIASFLPELINEQYVSILN